MPGNSNSNTCKRTDSRQIAQAFEKPPRPKKTDRAPLKQLRDYQAIAVDVLVDHLLPDAEERVVLVAPPAAGKTFTTLMVMKRLRELAKTIELNSEYVSPKRFMVIVPDKQLVQQWYRALLEFYDRPDVEKLSVQIDDGKTDIMPTTNVFIATWQRLHQPDVLAVHDPDEFIAVIYDECHSAASPCTSSVLRHFHGDVPLMPRRAIRPVRTTQPATRISMHQDGTKKLHHAHGGEASSDDDDNDNEDDEDKDEDQYEISDCEWCRLLKHLPDNGYRVPILVLSGTPNSYRPKDIYKVFPRRLELINNAQLVEAGLIAPVKLVSFTGYSFATPAGLARVNRAIIKNWEICREQGRRSTIVYCSSVKHAKDLHADSLDRGHSARYITGTTKREDRTAMLEAFRKGELPVLVNVNVLIQGVDLPDTDFLIDAQPSKKEGHIMQKLGRGRRPPTRPGKTDCLALDFTLNLKRRTGIMNFPNIMKDVEVVDDWPGWDNDGPGDDGADDEKNKDEEEDSTD